MSSSPDLTLAEESEFIELRNRIIRAQMWEFGAKVVNVSRLMNLAFGADGVRYHFKPRYAEPVERFAYESMPKLYIKKRPISQKGSFLLCGGMYVCLYCTS